MKLLRLAAVAIALGGFGVAQAEETNSQVLWSSFELSESSLFIQFNAVVSAWREREAAKSGIPIENIDATVADNRQGVANPGNCKHLALPGSRFMTERCFYESPGEAALNEWQYSREMVEFQEQLERNFLEEAEYGLAYRRYLNAQ
jgi:hypothetical protein